MSLGVDRFLNAIYVWCINRVPDDERERWDEQLTMPLPGERLTEATVQEEAEGFAAFAGMFGVTPTLTG